MRPRGPAAEPALGAVGADRGFVYLGSDMMLMMKISRVCMSTKVQVSGVDRWTRSRSREADEQKVVGDLDFILHSFVLFCGRRVLLSENNAAVFTEDSRRTVILSESLFSQTKAIGNHSENGNSLSSSGFVTLV